MDDDGCIPFGELPVDLQSQIHDRLAHVNLRLQADAPKLKTGGAIPYLAELFEAFVIPIEKAERWDLVKCILPWSINWLKQHWAPPPGPKPAPQRTVWRWGEAMPPPLARPPGQWTKAYLRRHIGDLIRSHELKAAAHAAEKQIAQVAAGPVLVIPERLRRSEESHAAAQRIAAYLESPSGLGLAAFAKKVDVHPRTIQRVLETGKADRKTFVAIAAAMGISLDDLLKP
jgi:hypothetical protein